MTHCGTERKGKRLTPYGTERKGKRLTHHGTERKRKRLTHYGTERKGKKTDTLWHRKKREKIDTLWHREKRGRGRHSVAQREKRERPTQCGTEINVEDPAGPTGDGLTPRSLRSLRSSRVLW